MTGPDITSRFIDHAIASRELVILLCALLLGLGFYSFRGLPIEAYPNMRLSIFRSSPSGPAAARLRSSGS